MLLVWELVRVLGLVVALAVALGGGGPALASGGWPLGVVGYGAGDGWVWGLAGSGLEGGRRWAGVEVLRCWGQGVAIVHREAVGGRCSGVVVVFLALGPGRLWSRAKGGRLRLVVSVV